MKNLLIIGTLAGLGFLVLWATRVQPPAVPRQTVAVRPDTAETAAVAVAQLEPAAPDPAASAAAPDVREGSESLPAPTYEEHAAARDLAAAHSARSR
jgi:hypothetical protein